MTIKIYEAPSEYTFIEYEEWMDLEIRYEEIQAETGALVNAGVESCSCDEWNNDLDRTPFVWIREEDGTESFIGIFYIHKSDMAKMDTYIRAKYPKTEVVMFLDVYAHDEKMYGSGCERGEEDYGGLSFD